MRGFEPNALSTAPVNEAVSNFLIPAIATKRAFLLNVNLSMASVPVVDRFMLELMADASGDADRANPTKSAAKA